MIRSPLNYTGGKFKLLPQLIQYFPTNINKFVDLFCGGCNVGINVSAYEHVFNDNCEELIHLYQTMQKLGKDEFISRVLKTIKNYSLSDSSTNGYEFYNCNSSKGLGKYNKEKFLDLRSDVNSLNKSDAEYSIMLFVLIVYSFNNQIRFNKKGEFNLPVGKRDFNKNMKSKLANFISQIQRPRNNFTSKDFRKMEINSLNSDDFVYVDPPYLITCATYNELGGWTKKDELDLLEYLNELTENDIKFALSNVLESKGEENSILKSWVKANPQYKIFNLNYSYKNSNYHKIDREHSTKEVLIVNY